MAEDRKKIKGLYIALLNLQMQPGYQEKLLGQQGAFWKAGIDMDVISLGNDSNIFLYKPTDSEPTKEIVGKYSALPLNNRIQLYFAAIRTILKRQPDVLYLRHFLADPILICFLMALKLARPSICVMAEVPTFPYDNIQEFRQTFKSSALLIQDRVLRHLLKVFYDRIVSIGYKPDIFGIKTISISNGVSIKNIKMRNYPIDDSVTLRIVGVGNINDYHGYDRLLETVRVSLDQKSRVRPIEFHIVSPITPALIRLKDQIRSRNLFGHFVFHGHKSGKELDEIFDVCHLAVGSLAWHRAKVSCNSNLKTREYVARGIPFIYAGIDEQLPADFEFALNVSADETPIDVYALNSFASRMKDIRDCTFQMRSYAGSNMSWSVSMGPVTEYLNNKFGKR